MVTLPTVQEFCIEIQHVLDCEVKYLEAEIYSLTAALETEADCAAIRPCTGSSSRSMESRSSDAPNVFNGRDSRTANGTSPRISKVRSRLPCKATSIAKGEIESSLTQEECDTLALRSGQSKFRNKLQAAKDENYFIDDYELGVS